MLTLTLVVVSLYWMLATSATSRPKYDEREYILNFPKSISSSYIVITACARLSSRILLYTEDPMKCKSILVKTADVYAYWGSHCSIQVKRLARLTEGPLGGVENV